MNNKIWLKFLTCIFAVSVFSSPTHAFYKKKVLVEKFQSPTSWEKTYNPGAIFSDLLSQELMHHERIQIISISKHMMRLMEGLAQTSEEIFAEPAIYDSDKTSFPEILSIQNSELPMAKPSYKLDPMEDKVDEDPTWPAKLGKRPTKSTFTKIRGKVIKFQPGAGDSSLESVKREHAEIQVHVEILQHNTGKVLYEKTFRAFSNAGARPFSVDELIAKNMHGKPGSSSMGFAFNYLQREIVSFISDKLDSLLLEGEIIAVRKKGGKPVIEEKVLLNLGSSNGIRIGDIFQVNAVGLEFHDPYTASDLGNVYVRVGVIKILQTWEGTATAISIGGKNFEVGYLVQSMTPLRESGLLSGNFDSTEPEEEKVPWWSFHGIRSVN